MNKSTKRRIRCNAIGRKDAQSARHRSMRGEWRFQALQRRKEELRELGVVLPLVPRKVSESALFRFERASLLIGHHNLVGGA